MSLRLAGPFRMGRPPLERATHMSLGEAHISRPDRLSGGRWKDRCRCVGLERVERTMPSAGRSSWPPCISGRRSCLALAAWRGMPAAGFGTNAAVRPRLLAIYRRAHAAPGRSDGPSVFDRTELRRARPSARGEDSGDDGGRPAPPAYPLHREGLAFDMATGPFRLAAAPAPSSSPSLIAAGPRMRFHDPLRRAGAADLVIDADLHRAGGDHLLGELPLRWSGRHPRPVARPLDRPSPPRADDVLPAVGTLPKWHPESRGVPVRGEKRKHRRYGNGRGRGRGPFVQDLWRAVLSRDLAGDRFSDPTSPGSPTIPACVVQGPDEAAIGLRRSHRMDRCVQLARGRRPAHADAGLDTNPPDPRGWA